MENRKAGRPKGSKNLAPGEGRLQKLQRDRERRARVRAQQRQKRTSLSSHTSTSNDHQKPPASGPQDLTNDDCTVIQRQSSITPISTTFMIPSIPPTSPTPRLEPSPQPSSPDHSIGFDKGSSMRTTLPGNSRKRPQTTSSDVTRESPQITLSETQDLIIDDRASIRRRSSIKPVSTTISTTSMRTAIPLTSPTSQPSPRLTSPDSIGFEKSPSTRTSSLNNARKRARTSSLDNAEKRPQTTSSNIARKRA